MIKLWTINRVLRWFGFRVCVNVDPDPEAWTLIGFKWYGWTFVKHGEGVHAKRTNRT